MHRHRIAVIPGDGAGIEVIDAGLTVLEAAAAADGGSEPELSHLPWGSDYDLEHGRMMAEEGSRCSAASRPSTSARRLPRGA
jgi:tartrate dehydrogenase/decarboxylase/D-malate dehydrogenase